VARKFVLIDPSIASIAGHYYEYAMHVLEAAQRAGFEPYLATHRRFAKSPHKAPWKTFAIYRVGYWVDKGAPGLIEKLLAAAGNARFRWRLFLNYSMFGLLWAVRDRFGEFLLKQPVDRPHLLSLATLIPAAILVKVLRFLGLLLFLPVALLIFLGRGTARLLKAGGFPESYVRSLLADVADLARFLLQLFARRNQFRSWLRQYRMLRTFQADTERLVREIGAGEGDVLFLPTTSALELMGLSEMLKQRDPRNGPSWRLLFRRDIYRGRETQYGAQDGQLNDLRQVMAVAARKIARHDVRFYTDTDELSAQHNRLGPLQFHTLPIPHTHRPVTSEGRKRPLTLLYIGDARSEKGYHLIPNLVEDLWKDYIVTGRIRFRLQSNFNVPLGEPPIVIARQKLELLAAQAPGAIELHKEAMTSERYKEFLLSGDINLLLYDPTNYYARSSGILVEALSTAMPVVAPAGTWLSRQFRDPTYQYRRSLRDTIPVARTYALSDFRWQAKGTRGSPVSGSGVSAGYENPAATLLRLPCRASHALIDISGPLECVLSIEQLDAKGNALAVSRTLLEADSDGAAVALCTLEEGCARLSIAIATPQPGLRATVTGLRLDLLAHDPQCGSLPMGCIGVAYDEPAGITAAVRELLDHFEHYSRSAHEFARGWQQYHNADRLVSEILQPGVRR
jgi:hypothetical protein